MTGDDARQSAKVWEADLGEAGRKLTPGELQALEALHHCELLGRIVVAAENMARHLSSLEGRFDRLEQFLMRADARYPQGPDPLAHHALPNGRDPR